MKRREALFGIAAGSLAAAHAALGAGASGAGDGTRSAARVSILDFGADATGARACDDALAHAIEAVGANGNQYYVGGPRIHFPPGTYRFERTIQLKRTVILEGDGVGAAGGYATVLKFPANTTGIVVQRYNTLGAGLESTPSRGGDGSIIRNLQLVGTRAGSTTGCGIWLRARATIEQVSVREFAEHGLQVLAAARTKDASVEGNANNFIVSDCTFLLNGGCGIYVHGADANAGVVSGSSCSHNAQWGIFDSSFLGNTYLGCHTEGNGKLGQVSDGTRRYILLDESRGGSTPPSTDASVWEAIGTGGAHPTYPLWAAGGSYKQGGSYKSDNRNARNCFIGCYSESGQGLADIRAPSIVIGGLFGNMRSKADGFVLSATTNSGKLSAFVMEQKTAAPRKLMVNHGTFPDQAITLLAEGDHPRGFAPLAWDERAGQWMAALAGNAAQASVRYTTQLNKATFGREHAIAAGNVAFARGIWVGESLESARYLSNGVAPPKAGEYAAGDRIFNSQPALGKPKSWVCIKAGTPGTWVSEGNL